MNCPLLATSIEAYILRPTHCVEFFRTDDGVELLDGNLQEFFNHFLTASWREDSQTEIFRVMCSKTSVLSWREYDNRGFGATYI